jgi:hypothetical protein
MIRKSYRIVSLVTKVFKRKNSNFLGLYFLCNGLMIIQGIGIIIVLIAHYYLVPPMFSKLKFFPNCPKQFLQTSCILVYSMESFSQKPSLPHGEEQWNFAKDIQIPTV